MDFKEILERLSCSEDLTPETAESAIRQIMSGQVNNEQVAGFLTAMRLKGETHQELTAFVKVMREKATKVNVNVDGAIDLVGTGGDKSGTFNISTVSAFVVAGAGVPVIKHNNRSASSKCGSADVLEKLGVDIELKANQVERLQRSGNSLHVCPHVSSGYEICDACSKSAGLQNILQYTRTDV